jgi:hypothetical protein
MTWFRLFYVLHRGLAINQHDSSAPLTHWLSFVLPKCLMWLKGLLYYSGWQHDIKTTSELIQVKSGWNWCLSIVRWEREELLAYAIEIEVVAVLNNKRSLSLVCFEKSSLTFRFHDCNSGFAALPREFHRHWCQGVRAVEYSQTHCRKAFFLCLCWQ